jgi:NADH dehydrogenase/NADH:ubiquinone oxidoreductase subunit G
MAGLFDADSPLVAITVLGRTLEVPRDESLLRQLQFVAPEVAMGRFCWNGECRNCEVGYLGSTGVERPGLACVLKGQAGMRVVRLSPDLRMAAAESLERLPASPERDQPDRPA